MPGGIFISYRREDAAPYARLLQAELSKRFPASRVFIDVDSIGVGLDFVDVIQQAIGSSAVLIALIGRRWTTLTDRGGRRLDNPDDFVRMELSAALTGGVRVFPVLVDGAAPLRADELPAELRKLARLNAVELSYSRYDFDAQRLFTAVTEALETRAAAESITRPAAPPFHAGEGISLDHGDLSGLLVPRPINDLAFSRDGDLLAGAGQDRTVRAWRVSNGIPQFIARHPAPMSSVAFSPTGRRLAMLGDARHVVVRQIGSRAEEQYLRHDDLRSGLAWSPDGRLLAAGADRSVLLWNMPGGDLRARLPVPARHPVVGVAFSPDGRRVAVAANEAVTIRDATDGTELTRLGATPARRVTLSPDGGHLAAWGSVPELWRLPQPERRPLPGTAVTDAMAFSADGSHLAVGDGNAVAVLDLAGPEPVPVARLHVQQTVSALAFSPDGRFLAAGTAGSRVMLWRLG